MNTAVFLQKMNALQDEKTLKSINLEELLRALWGQINTYKDAAPTWELFVALFEQAWIADPVPFDDAWMQVDILSSSSELNTAQNLKDFASLQQQILCQIADLRRMREAGYYERSAMELYLGVDSPTGARWYNWYIPDFLEAALRSLEDGTDDPAKELEEARWIDLSLLLHSGQHYE